MTVEADGSVNAEAIEVKFTHIDKSLEDVKAEIRSQRNMIFILMLTTLGSLISNVQASGAP